MTQSGPSYLIHLWADLAPEIPVLMAQGKLDQMPYRISLVDAEDEFLGSCEIEVADGNVKTTAISEDNPKVYAPVFPVTMIITDASGNRHEMTWTPPTRQ